MKIRLALGYLFLQCLIISAQTSPVDSLKRIVTTTSHDTTRIITMGEISFRYMKEGFYDSAMTYAWRTINEARAALTEKGIRKAPDNGIVAKTWTGRAYNIIGLVYKRQGNYPEALKHLLMGLKVREETGDKKEIASSYNNIGNVYFDMNNNQDALNYYKKALKMNEELGIKARIADCLNNVGNALYNENDLGAALQNFTASLAIRLDINDQHGIAASYGNIGVLNVEQGDRLRATGDQAAANKKYQEGLRNDLSSLKIMEELNDALGIESAVLNTGSAYNKLKQYKRAEDLARRGLRISNELGDLDGAKTAYQLFSEIYTSSGNFKRALESYKLFIAARDSLVNEENTKKAVRLEMNYEFEKRQAATKLELEKKEALALAQRKKQQIILISVIGVMILLLIFAVFAYRSYLQKQKANLAITRQKELIEEKQREILDSIHYASRIQRALIPTDRYVEGQLKKLRNTWKG